MERKGFTLIELLVVIAIIGILSGVVLASLNTARLKARNAQRISDARQVALALEFFFDDQATGKYPTSAIVDFTTGQTLLAAQYLPQTPIEPVTGRQAYRYRSDAPSVSYCFGVSLEGTAPINVPDNDRVGCRSGGADPNVLTPAAINYAIGP
ncbi:MAG: hypothetical protein Greene07144_1086 [Parcubacteria group bacterium Greene0714_4]|nr:MAG: hypothetical protein Greene07144_1086 [Parcubacteria group bacterium Greene0714_4]